MAEEEKIFYTIGEVSEKVGVKPYVLRYWESEFRKLNPEKSTTGQRTYRPKDIEVALTIKRLLYDEKYTIAGAIQKLDELEKAGGFAPKQAVAAPPPPSPSGKGDAAPAKPEKAVPDTESPAAAPNPSAAPASKRRMSAASIFQEDFQRHHGSESLHAPAAEPDPTRGKKIRELKDLLQATQSLLKKHLLA